MTTWHMAEKKGKLEILQKIQAWAKDKVNTEEINIKALLVTEYIVRTVCHMTAKWDKAEVLQKIWEWTKEI